MKNGNSLKYRVIVIALLSVVGFFLVKGVFSEYRLSKEYCFVIGTTIGREPGGYVKYQFKVKGVVYTNSDKAHRLNPSGRHYLVKCNPSDPSGIAKIVSEDEIASCIGEQPDDGWKEIPKCE